MAEENDAGNEPINLKVRDQTGDEMTFKVRLYADSSCCAVLINHRLESRRNSKRLCRHMLREGESSLSH